MPAVPAGVHRHVLHMEEFAPFAPLAPFWSSFLRKLKLPQEAWTPVSASLGSLGPFALASLRSLDPFRLAYLGSLTLCLVYLRRPSYFFGGVECLFFKFWASFDQKKMAALVVLEVGYKCKNFTFRYSIFS